MHGSRDRASFFLAPRSFPGGADPSGANLFRSASIFGFGGPREGVDGGLQGLGIRVQLRPRFISIVKVALMEENAAHEAIAPHDSVCDGLALLALFSSCGLFLRTLGYLFMAAGQPVQFRPTGAAR